MFQELSCERNDERGVGAMVARVSPIGYKTRLRYVGGTSFDFLRSFQTHVLYLGFESLAPRVKFLYLASFFF